MPDTLSSDQMKLLRIVDEIDDYAIILIDKDGTVENWNKGASKIIGYSAAEIIGKNFAVFYTSEDRSKGLPGQLIHEAIVNGKAYSETWRVRKDGLRFWAGIVITAMHDDQGEVIGFTKVIRDLTSAKTNEEMLRKAEERYNKMIKEIADYAIILLDDEGNIQNWNDGAQRIKGYSETEAIGKNFQIFYTREDRENKLPLELLGQAKLNGRTQHEGWRVRKDGTTFWGLVSITALHNDLGEVIGFSKVTRDLTQKLEAEKLQHEHVTELKIKNKELEQFSYITSHDLQEPLKTITNFAGLLQKNHQDNLNDKAKIYIDIIISSAFRMSGLIKGLLDYSRIGVKKQLCEIDFKKLLQDIQIDLSAIIAETNATIKSDQLPLLFGYPTELYQLFQNLIGNAIKYKKEGRAPEINISAHEAADAWLFTVKDNGIGINLKYRHKIFLIFQRLHGREEYPGNGIGLAHCKKIVELHGGEIWVESEPENGSSFHFTIAKQIK